MYSFSIVFWFKMSDRLAKAERVLHLFCVTSPRFSNISCCQAIM